MAPVHDILKKTASSLSNGDIPSLPSGDISSGVEPTPKYVLNDGTIVTFESSKLKRITIGTKNEIENYRDKSSSLISYSSLAAKAAEFLGTVIEEELPPPPSSETSIKEFIEYKIQGKIVSDPGNTPIEGAKIKNSLGDKTTTEKTGDFELVGSYEKNTQFSINVKSKGYGEETITPFNQDDSIKTNVGIVILTSNELNLKESIRKELLIPDIQLKALKLSKTNAEMAQQQAMNKLMTTIKTVLVPAVLAQIAAFGISKASEAIGKKFGDLKGTTTCPANIDELNRLIAKKNRLVKQLNNIYKTLERVELGVKIVDGIITAAQIIYETLLALNLIPSTFASPQPGKTTDMTGEIRKKLQKYKLISSITLMVLAMLIAVLKYILDLLALLDLLIQGCAEEIANKNNLGEGGIGGSSDSDLLVQSQVSQELLDSTIQQSNQLSPVVTNVNGFKMGVETEITDKPLKRRRATAKNTEGVIVLLGEYSYSSNDQILIDELVFYIQQNDLKAE